MSALLDHLRIDRVKAIGMSLGAKALLHIATAQPARVDAMVLVSATPYFPEPLRAAAAQFTRESFDRLSEAERAALRQRHVHGDEQIRQLYDMTRSFATSCDDMAFTPPQLATITARTLIVHGDRDPLYPVEMATALFHGIPQSALWVVPYGGHGPIFGDLTRRSSRRRSPTLPASSKALSVRPGHLRSPDARVRSDQMELVTDLTLILVAALAGGFLARRLGQPLIVGYIVAGIIVGPFTGGLSVVNVHGIEQLAEIGVALLLFSLGLEVSFRELAPVRSVAVGGGAIQIVLTIAVGAGLALVAGWPWQPALWFGALVALSSTMVVLKTLQAQGRLGTLSSRVMLGILVVQDLAVVPLMIILPELGNPAGGAVRVVLATIRSLALLGAIVLVSTRVVPRVIATVARWNSRELFMLATTAIALGIGYAAWRSGLSLAVGAFVAGLVINESEYAHQALSDVMPLRDLFGMLFFVSVGMLMDPALVRAQLPALALVIPSILIGKTLILAGVVRAFGYRRVVPLAVGLTLFQVGEFAFVLARVGRATGAISDDLYALALNTAVATMAITPAVSGLTSSLYRRFAGGKGSESPQAINIPATGLADHVVVCGAGRVGRTIADALGHLRLPCVLVELDDARVQQARVAGLPVVYGDATQGIVLEAAGISRARALLITLPAFVDVRAIVVAVRSLSVQVPIIARAEGPDAVRALYELGVEEATSPEYEGAIEMTRQALVHLNVPAHEILQVAGAVRRVRSGLAADGAQKSPVHTGDIARHLDLAWLTVPEGSAFSGRTLGDLKVRTMIGPSVVGLIHAGTLIANPHSGARLEAGDLVAVFGTRDQIARFERASSARGDA